MPFMESISNQALDERGAPGTRESVAPMVSAMALPFDSADAAQSSVTAIWQREHGRLMRSARRIVRDTEVAEDCASETWINTVAEVLERIADGQAIDTKWVTAAMFRSIRFTALHMLRARRETVPATLLDSLDTARTVLQCVHCAQYAGKCECKQPAYRIAQQHDAGVRLNRRAMRDATLDMRDASIEWIRSVADEDAWRIISYWIDWDGKRGYSFNSAEDCAESMRIPVQDVRYAIVRTRKRIGGLRMNRLHWMIESHAATPHGITDDYTLWPILALCGLYEVPDGWEPRLATDRLRGWIAEHRGLPTNLRLPVVRRAEWSYESDVPVCPFV